MRVGSKEGLGKNGFHQPRLRKGSATKVMMRIGDQQGICLVVTGNMSAGGYVCGRLDTRLYEKVG